MTKLPGTITSKEVLFSILCSLLGGVVSNKKYSCRRSLFATRLIAGTTLALSRVSPSFLPLYLLSSRNPSFLDLPQTPKSKQTQVERSEMGEGREGDWECGGCQNRNYAFRSFCNRCKQPRLLVDTKTPADSKWLPRIGDWICTGCSNNNYASREKCKKCGQPKEVAAIPAIAMPGASLPTHAHYFARAHGGLGFKMNAGMAGNPNLQQSLPLNSSWPYGVSNKYPLHSAPGWSFGGNNGTAFPYANNASQVLMVPKGWRNGDWICNCGFHNYASRAQCKKCNASMPSGAPSSVANSTVPDLFPTLGTKRLASEEFINDWDNKRLNAGEMSNHSLTSGPQHSYQGYGQMTGPTIDQTPGMHTSYPSGSSAAAPNFQMHVQSPQLTAMPTLLGKGRAKQWRDGDWMCTNCNNHNYASRSHCNRCKTQKDAVNQQVSVA